MRRVAVAVCVSIVIIVSGIAAFFFIPSGGYTPVPDSSGIAAIVTGALPDPPIDAYFPLGYVTPSMWGLKSADGTTTMTVYNSGSIDFTSDLWNVNVGGSITGYPHVGFNLSPYFPMRISELTSLTAYASFDIYDISPFILSTDFSYDFYVQSSPIPRDGIQYEVMIWEFFSSSYPLSRVIGLVNIPATINGEERDVSWLISEAKYNGQNYPTVIFAPMNFNSRAMTWEISIPEFIGAMQKVLRQNLSADYIPELNLGSEFGTALFPNEICDWTLTYWYEIGNKKYDILGKIGA